MTNNPAISVLRAERDKLAQKLELIMAEAKEVRAGLRSFDEAIAVLEGGSPISITVHQERSGGGKPPLKVIILEILQEKPGLGTQEIKAELLARGRDTDANTILGTLSRMRREDASIHKRDGVWFGGAGESNADDVYGNEKAPEQSGALQEVGHVAERSIAPGSKPGGEVPGKSSPVGSNPTVSAPIRKDLLSSASGLLGSTQTPFFKR